VRCLNLGRLGKVFVSRFINDIGQLRSGFNLTLRLDTETTMAKISYAVVPIDGGWLVKGEEASFAFEAGSKAEAKARELAQAA